MKKCNCWIGILNAHDQSHLNWLHLENYIDVLGQKAQHSIDMERVYRHYVKVFKPQDYIDRRRNMATLFDHCPCCGAKINWKAIRAALK